MIKIDKSSVAIPATLLDPTIQTKLDLIWNNGAPRKYLIESEIYRANDVLAALSTLYHDKCAYCETHDPDFEVEHFRPKKLVSVIDRTNGQAHDGYYWLCYEWSNLMPGCHDCNKNGVKGNRFPTRSVKKNTPLIMGLHVDLTCNSILNSYLKDEKAIFLNPEEPDFDPFVYFKFDKDGHMDPKPNPRTINYKRSNATITVFKLNRDKIFANYRKWHIHNRIRRIEMFFLELNSGEIVFSYFKKKYFEILEEIFAETPVIKQYSFFWQYFYQNIDIFILNHINKEVSDFIEPLTIEFKTNK